MISRTCGEYFYTSAQNYEKEIKCLDEEWDGKMRKRQTSHSCQLIKTHTSTHSDEKSDLNAANCVEARKMWKINQAFSHLKQ